MVPAQSIVVPTTTTGLIVVQGLGAVKGWALKETTGAAPAVANLWDGTANNGLLIAPINLAANESTRDWFGELGVSFVRGLFVEVTSGSVSGALWVIPQEFLTVDGARFAYATSPAADGYPSMGIQELE